MESEYPELIARFYDVTYEHIRNSADHDFYLQKILEASGPVLEVGAGTGRFFAEALAKGADIYAVEPSVHMLEKLKARIDTADHHRVMLTDAGSMVFDRQFSLIIAPFRVFGHLLSPEDQFRALDTIHKHLQDDGEFIFDLYIPDPGMIASGIDEVTDFDGTWAEGKRLKRTISMTSDIVAQVSTVTMRFDWEEEDGWHSGEWTFPMRYYFRYELEHLLERSPFRSHKILGDFAGTPLNLQSREFICVCGK